MRHCHRSALRASQPSTMNQSMRSIVRLSILQHETLCCGCIIGILRQVVLSSMPLPRLRSLNIPSPILFPPTFSNCGNTTAHLLLVITLFGGKVGGLPVLRSEEHTSE